MIHKWLTLVALFYSSTTVLADDINIAVAANFAAPMQSLVAAFEANSTHQVSVSLGSSGKFYAQIRNGAPFELFFSADQAKPIALENADYTVTGSRFTYAIGALALWSAKRLDLANTPFDFQADRYKLALANPKLAPYGKAAVEVLNAIGMREVSEKHWVMGENIAQTYQFVYSQNVDVGFVAISQIMRDGKISQGSAWRIPTDLYAPIRQDVVLLKSGQHSLGAQAFLAFLRSATASKIIQSYGYTVPNHPSAPRHYSPGSTNAR